MVIETSTAGVNEQAVNLLDRFDAQRRPLSPQRPIIFIAHSLGGIIVKSVRLSVRVYAV